jgi:hypothetical protein
LVIFFGPLEAAQHHLAQALRATRAGDVAALLAQGNECVVHVSDQLYLREEVVVDLGG